MSLKVDGTKYLRTKGRLAQLVEQDVYTIKVGGSSPSSPTTQEAESEYLELSAFMFYEVRRDEKGLPDILRGEAEVKYRQPVLKL